MVDYAAFLDRKAQLGQDSGFDPGDLPSFLYGFQEALTRWAIRKGRAAIFADCGLGKTPMQLVWSDAVAGHTGGRVLILTPLAVGPQTVREGEKFNIECARSLDGKPAGKITVANYERLHHFDARDYAGVVCDESSILKHFGGVRRRQITRFMSKVPYRLLCTATAAPNDYVELGTSSEALGNLGHIDMLSRFFKNTQNTIAPVRRWTANATGWGSLAVAGDRGKWILKGHAHDQFWRWVCSWARALRKPSDFGFDDDGFVLPPMSETVRIVKARKPREGMLFPLPAVGLAEQREERRETIHERCEKVAELVADTTNPAVCWCHLNAEGDLLERIIPDAVQVSGKDSDGAKEEKFAAFQDGSVRVLVTKPKIGAWGLNWQHCAHMTFFPSHSFEQYYQGTRRCWRFGQTREVVVDIVASEAEADVMANLQRKAEAADKMFAEIVDRMNESLHVQRTNPYEHTEEVPAWL